MAETKKARLILADGTLYEGYSFGAAGTTIGEVVFTTGMTGFQETLTDPSYYGQIITQTFPLIGNYGVNEFDAESKRCSAKGYIVREWCEEPSNFRSKYTVEEFLKSQGIIGLYGIDTRALTRKIREYGVMNGMITTEDIEPDIEKIRNYVIDEAVHSVSCGRPLEYKVENPKFNVVLLDYGYKFNIRRTLCGLGLNVIVLPGNSSPEEILKYRPDGIMLSNGPGDPKENVQIIENLRSLMATGIPIFGICLGHQLLALAAGADTEKLKYGHRGANQPVKELETGRTFVTTQNHGYAVISGTIPKNMGMQSHINANDGTCEGVIYTAFPAFTVQFHPEACAGPQDTRYLFERFVELMQQHKGGK